MHSTGATLTSTIASFRMISAREDAWLASIAHRPEVALETKNYLSRIENIKSVAEFVSDDRVFRFAMKAHGLEEMAYAKGFIRKLLTDGVDSDTALANRLVDPRYREFAETFNFARYGETTTIFDRTRQGTVDRFVRQTMEESAGAQNEDLRLALYFKRLAPTITSPYQILADRALTQVIHAALGLSSLASAADIDVQADAIARKLEFSDLQSPRKVDLLIARFAALSDAKSGLAVSGAPQLLSQNSTTRGLGVDILMQLQSAKLGARLP